jgi:hypothetical protein
MRGSSHLAAKAGLTRHGEDAADRGFLEALQAEAQALQPGPDVRKRALGRLGRDKS